MHVTHGAGEGFPTAFPGANAYPPNMLILQLDRDCSFPQALQDSGSLRQGRCPPSLARGCSCLSCAGREEELVAGSILRHRGHSTDMHRLPSPLGYSWSQHKTPKPWAQRVWAHTLQDGIWQSVSITSMPATQLSPPPQCHQSLSRLWHPGAKTGTYPSVW